MQPTDHKSTADVTSQSRSNNSGAWYQCASTLSVGLFCTQHRHQAEKFIVIHVTFAKKVTVCNCIKIKIRAIFVFVIILHKVSMHCDEME